MSVSGLIIPLCVCMCVGVHVRGCECEREKEYAWETVYVQCIFIVALLSCIIREQKISGWRKLKSWRRLGGSNRLRYKHVLRPTLLC